MLDFLWSILPVGIFYSWRVSGAWLGMFDLGSRQGKQEQALSAADGLFAAGEQPASFHPETLPLIPGWQFALQWLVGGKSTGDYFDLIPLPDGRYGLLITDVVGMGKHTLSFMAQSHALFRSYLHDYDSNPDELFCAINKRILGGEFNNQFISAFFAVLDLANGRMTYSNAGHAPPLKVDGNRWKESRWLGPTGVPLGIMEGCKWQVGQVTMSPKEVLVLYSDGVIEAENGAGEQYGRKRLLHKVRALVQGTAAELQGEIIGEVGEFVGERPLLDDIVLSIVKRS